MALIAYLPFGFEPVFLFMACSKISCLSFAVSAFCDQAMEFVWIDTFRAILL